MSDKKYRSRNKYSKDRNKKFNTRHKPFDKRARQKASRRGIFMGLGALFLAFFACSSIVSSFVSNFSGNSATSETWTNTEEITSLPRWSEESANLTIAVSPVMAPVMQGLVEDFNQLDNETDDGERMVVTIETMAPEKMINAAAGTPGFQAISPDSTLWLEELEKAWQKRNSDASVEETSAIPIGKSRVSLQTRYAVSPVVIATWEDTARDLGWPDQPVGWQDIQAKATQDPDFKWNHASTNTASGLLATLAEFYAGAGLTRGLTEEAATAQSTLDYVQAVESTISFYGEGEEVIVQRLESEGRDFLDAFVAQERVVIEWNRTHSGDERLVAIYPSEGTLWTDHPLALLELGGVADEQRVTDNQRLTYTEFSEYLASNQAQQQLLQSGYRPADLNINLDGAGSPFADVSAASAVDWRQPQTTLQMPSPSVVDVVRNVWVYTKRPTNVYLVVDTSGSMDEGPKLPSTKEALKSFVLQIQGDRDRLGLVEFGSGVKDFTPLRVMDDTNRNDLVSQIDQMEPYGGTALVDAVYKSISDLQSQNDLGSINALVVMTDGQENESAYRLRDIERLMEVSPVPMVIFTIAFGTDADEPLLRNIAEIGNGQFRRASETNIEELYRIVSTYF